MKFSSLILAASLVFSQFASADTNIYVSESKDNRVAIFSLDEKTGDLTRRGDITLAGAPGSLALSKDQSKIYAAVRSASEFATLSIDPKTGFLKLAGTAPAAGSAAYVYPDKTGNWLLAAYYGEGQVSVSKIENGIVKGEPVQIFATGKKAHCIQVDPSNQFAFTPHTGDLNKVQQFQFNADNGTLSLNDPPQLDGAEGAGPRHMQFHPNGEWAYLVNEQSKSVTHCDFDPAKGTLIKRKTLSSHPADWDLTKGSCADIEISADGKFLYCSNRGHNSIGMFSINQDTGELTSLGQESTEDTPRSFNLIPGGEKFLVAAGQRSNTLAVYRRDAKTGRLEKLKTYDCGGSPAWVMGVHFAD
ncbi:MAG: lactonase family protein [Verrucomicrobiales bacterium]|nr:lactonase family protein [Verrucomicrobiales bacterium]